MTSRRVDRRTFLTSSVSAGVGIFGLCLCSGLRPAVAGATEAEAPIDPAALEYCGYTCPKDCKFRQATLADDVELKREAWKIWKIEERFGLQFDAEQAFCHGCKAPGKPEGITVSRCDVRTCVREKKLEGCIECAELADCDKTLWDRFPEFHTQVIELQKRYRAQA